MNPDNQAFNLVAFLRQIETIIKWKQSEEDKIRQFKNLSTAYVATLPNDVIHFFHEWERKLSGKKESDPEES